MSEIYHQRGSILSYFYMYLFKQCFNNIQKDVSQQSIYNFDKSAMECPKCKSYSVKIENGSKVCGVRTCTYIDLHPISYENDVMHYEGEDKKENRFTSLYSHTLDNGGIELEKQANFDKNFKKGRRIICDICFVLKQNQSIIDISTARYLAILKIMHKEKKNSQQKQKESSKSERQQEGDMQKNQDEKQEKEIKREKKDKHKNILSNKNIAGYSIYSACFQKENYFEEFNISRLLKLQIKDWKELVKELNQLLKFKIDFVPIVKPKHIIIRVCKRRKIHMEEQKAMIEMCQRITKDGAIDARNNTVAAIAFWKVCDNSLTYKDKANLVDICKVHDKMQADRHSINQIQKCFDVTPENVRKVFKESISAHLFTRYLPNWQGRITIKEKHKQQQ